MRKIAVMINKKTVSWITAFWGQKGFSRNALSQSEWGKAAWPVGTSQGRNSRIPGQEPTCPDWDWQKL